MRATSTENPKLEIDQFSGDPFIKWAGGKTQLLNRLEDFFPKKFNRYFEPFVGGAAVFFYLRRTRGSFPAFLMDANEELINCYKVVRDNVELLIPLLHQHQREHSERYYYNVRGLNPQTLDELRRAARFIYLNKTCYNGLHRVNAKGQFNVPIGSYDNPKICDEVTLLDASVSLRGAILAVADFSEILDSAQQGDFIYFDPPYYSETVGFTGYAVGWSGKAGFGAEEQRRLAEVYKELHQRDCHVVLSNSDTDYIRRLYAEFDTRVVQARRAVNSNGAKRGHVDEIVVTNYERPKLSGYKSFSMPRIAASSKKISQDIQVSKEDVPQANTLPVVGDLLALGNAGYTDTEELVRRMGMAEREVNYYKQAARILGFIQISKQDKQVFHLSKLGLTYLKATRPIDKHTLMSNAVRSTAAFSYLLRRHREDDLNQENLEDFVQSTGLTGSTVKRRAQSLIAWLAYINSPFGKRL